MCLLRVHIIRLRTRHLRYVRAIKRAKMAFLTVRTYTYYGRIVAAFLCKSYFPSGRFSEAVLLIGLVFLFSADY